MTTEGFVVFEGTSVNEKSSELAKVFVNRFNATEATAAVMLAYSDDEDTDTEGAGFGLLEDKNHQVHDYQK